MWPAIPQVVVHLVVPQKAQEETRDMSRWLGRLLAASTLAGVLVLVALVIGAPHRSPAQQPQPTPPAADLPQGYVGAEACKQCHEEQFQKFEKTKMGRLFLKHPRDATERLGCENCHGPGK